MPENRHPKLGAVGEVERTLAPRLVALLEVRLLRRTRLRTPYPHTPYPHASLHRPDLPIGVPAGVLVGEHIDDGFRLEHAAVICFQ